MSKKVAFRFDVDTVSCIKHGIPKLVNISNKYNVEFNIFMNFGRSIDRKEALTNRSKSFEGTVNKLSTLTKLGPINYILTILVNPRLDKYKDEIKLLINSKNEVGLHGGLNHGTWQLHGNNFDIKRLEKEINYGLEKAKKYNITFSGFTSPGMTSNKLLGDLLVSKNFKYISDTYTFENESTEDSKKSILKGIKNINVNLAGPKGVGYFEYYLSKKLEPKKIKEKLLNKILNSDQDIFVIYDHPLIMKFIESEFIDLVKELKKSDVNIIKFSDLK